MLSGGKGQLYGNGYTCYFMSGWKFHIDTVGVTQFMIWHGFFSSLPWQDLVPDQDHRSSLPAWNPWESANTRQQERFCHCLQNAGWLLCNCLYAHRAGRSPST